MKHAIITGVLTGLFTLLVFVFYLNNRQTVKMQAQTLEQQEMFIRMGKEICHDRDYDIVEIKVANQAVITKCKKGKNEKN